jgi:F-type H+-transporting ATPase subunit b
MEYEALAGGPVYTHGSFWVFVAVVIFALLAGRRIISAITAMLDARTKSVSDALAEAARLKSEAEIILADAKARHAQAMEDAEKILELAQQEAATLAAALTAEAEAIAKRREQMAVDRIAAAEAAAVKEVRAAAINTATATAAALLRAEVGPQGDAALIDHAITTLPGALRA